MAAGRRSKSRTLEINFRFLRPVHDRLDVVVKRFSPGEALAADDLAPGYIQFTCLRLVTNRHLDRYLGTICRYLVRHVRTPWSPPTNSR
jgi:hypothetical protein